MIIRQAEASDLDHIVQWRTDAARWLASLGSDQWSDAGLSDEAFIARVRDSISNGETWMAEQDGQPVGTIAVDQWTDEGLWSAVERAESMFIHRMIISRGSSGQGIGKLLLDHADKVAANHGKRWIRLDAWTTNKGLHAYYESAGFRHLRTVSDHSSSSAALFERPVRAVEEHEIPSRTRRPVIELGELDHGNPSPPDHWHQADGLTVRGEPHLRDGALMVSSHSRPLHVWHDGTHWLISEISPSARYNAFARTVLKWEVRPTPDPSKRYLIKHHEDERGCRLVLQADTPEEGSPHEEAVRKTP